MRHASQRVGPVRAGYRHGKRVRTLTTSLGATTIAMPRARIEDDDGRRREWHSRMIPRYQRRTERVDEAILGVYLSGTNTRRLRGALSPLLRGAPLSKDAVSRLVGRLRLRRSLRASTSTMRRDEARRVARARLWRRSSLPFRFFMSVPGLPRAFAVRCSCRIRSSSNAWLLRG